MGRRVSLGLRHSRHWGRALGIRHAQSPRPGPRDVHPRGPGLPGFRACRKQGAEEVSLPHEDRKVKRPEECKGANPYSWTRSPFWWMLWEIDCHPRLGWFWVVLVVVHAILNLLRADGLR